MQIAPQANISQHLWLPGAPLQRATDMWTEERSTQYPRQPSSCLAKLMGPGEVQRCISYLGAAGEVLILVRSGGWVNGWCETILALTRGCACSARLHAHTHTHTHTHICTHTQACAHKHTQHYLQFLSGPQGRPSLLLAQMSKGQ